MADVIHVLQYVFQREALGFELVPDRQDVARVDAASPDRDTVGVRPGPDEVRVGLQSPCVSASAAGR